MMRLKIGLVLGLLLGAAVGGVAMLTPPTPEEKAAVRVDRYGDPLPPGALQRLGTRRHRVQNGRLPWQDMPDGKSYLAYQELGQNNEIRRLDAVTGRVLETWPVPNDLAPVAFSPDGRFVLMTMPLVYRLGFRGLDADARQDWVLTLYDLAKRKPVWKINKKLKESEWKQIESVRFSADGKWIATGLSLRLWDAATGKELWTREQGTLDFDPLGFTEGGTNLVVRGNADNGIRLFDIATGKRGRSFPTMPPLQASWFGLSPDGSTVLCGTYGPSVRLWDTATGKEKPALEGHKQSAWCFAFSPDGKTLVTGGNDPFVLVRSWP